MAHTTIIFNPNALTTRDDINAAKLDITSHHKGEPHAILVLPDYDGTLYVVEGNRRAESARQNHKPIKGVLVEDDHPVGNQTALERAFGIFFLKKER